MNAEARTSVRAQALSEEHTRLPQRGFCKNHLSNNSVRLLKQTVNYRLWTVDFLASQRNESMKHHKQAKPL